MALEERLRMQHASPRTIEAYCQWVRRFIKATGRRYPSSLGSKEVTSFLSYWRPVLATEEHVSASMQNQTLAALLFLYKEVLGKQRLPPHRFWHGRGRREGAQAPQRVDLMLGVPSAISGDNAERGEPTPNESARLLRPYHFLSQSEHRRPAGGLVSTPP